MSRPSVYEGWCLRKPSVPLSSSSSVSPRNLTQLVWSWEAALSPLVLLAAPLLLRTWASAEAKAHDTLECRNVLQTYLLAAGGCITALLAAWAGNPVTALVLQVASPGSTASAWGGGLAKPSGHEWPGGVQRRVGPRAPKQPLAPSSDTRAEWRQAHSRRVSAGVLAAGGGAITLDVV